MSASAKPAPPRRVTPAEARVAGKATKDANARASCRVARAEAAPAGHPFLAAREGPPFLVRRLLSASSMTEWNDAVAEIVEQLAALSHPEKRLTGAEGRYLVALVERIRGGFVGPPHRRKQKWQAEDDAVIISANNSAGLPACETMSEATARLAEWHRIKPEAARKRVKRAMEASGLALRPAPRFGKKG